MIKFECNECGGQLVENGKFWVCEHCGTKYALGRDDEGQPFAYQPVEKKSVECGQMGVKASKIEVNTVSVREIKLKDTINVDVHNESLNIDTNESIKLAKTYIKESDWEGVRRQVNRLLLTDVHCAEAQWYGIMCNRTESTEGSLISNWFDFTQADAIKLDDILANSSPEFAKHIIDLMFRLAYVSDTMSELVLKTILPYAKNECIYTESELEKQIDFAFSATIEKTYDNTFLYLLNHTLRSDEIDKYIDYLTKFAKQCSPEDSIKYLKMITKVDPGNIDAHREIVKADIVSSIEKDNVISDFEELLKYTNDTDAETYRYLEFIISLDLVDEVQSDVFWDMLGYHSKAPVGLKSEILLFSKVLLNSSCWKEARNYLNLILSFDARNADAYWGLCLARMQARNESELISKKEDIGSIPEYDKCLSLYQSNNNDGRAKEILSLKRKQKDTKAAKKKMLITAAVIVAAIIVIFTFSKIINAKKYSVNNIVVKVIEKQEVYNGYATDLVLEVKNKSSQDVRTVECEMKIYNSDDDKILDVVGSLKLNVKSGETVTTVLEIDSGITTDIEELCALDLENLKITYRTTSIIYASGKSKDYPKSKTKTINKITEEKSYEEIVYEQELYEENRIALVQEKYDQAISNYAKVDVESSNFEDEINQVVQQIKIIWLDIQNSTDLMSNLYNTAYSYMEKNDFEKAYYLFELLGSVDYKDSEAQSYYCVRKMYSFDY